MWGGQYALSTQDYDGVSEWTCVEGCKLRLGRWSGKRLEKGYIERRYGGEPVFEPDYDRE